MPMDPTSLGDSELMVLFSKYVQWENYIAVTVGEHEFDEMRAENQFKLVFARCVASSMEKPMGARNEAILSEPVQIAQDRWDEAKSYRKAFGLQRDAVARLSALISRELTRRSSHSSERRLEKMMP